MNIKPQTGRQYPLGSTLAEDGVNFALFSANATAVELCLYDEYGIEEIARFDVKNFTNEVWHIFIPGIKAGQVYGYRVDGKYDPKNGLRFNKNKLLIDPYAKSLSGKLIWNKAIFGYDIDSEEKDLSFSELDSAPYVPKSVVVDDDYDWGDIKKPRVRKYQSIIYEAHTKGLTALHPDVPDSHKGKFKGLENKKLISYLKDLGVTSLELLPVFNYMGNRQDMSKNHNYWGYETYNFFSLENNFLINNNINEFKDFIKAYHKEGLEVILDVVYNHTGEGNQLGPTLSYRGIDNSSYYKLSTENPRYYYDSTGCGASLNIANHNVLRMVMDSLRYWVEVMQVDGFRFDLASTLCRTDSGFSQESGFMYAVHQDPVLQRAKLIAEPWDLDMDGYQLGAYTPKWLEWNDKFRDNVRKFWRGDENQISELASRVTGSSDVFGYRGRKPYSSVNFITAHDGFCMKDLVSYNGKHNLANGEENRDGTDSNWSWNSGVEGYSSDKKVKKLRLKRIKSMFATLLLSQGVPMIVAGDEFARSQVGNNNPYCQDNVISWLNWSAIDKEDKEILTFVKALTKLRSENKAFTQNEFFNGKIVDETTFKDVTWLMPSGKEYDHDEWHNPQNKFLSYLINGSKNKLSNNKNTYFVIMNASKNKKEWKLPAIEEFSNWVKLIDSSKINQSFRKEYEFGDKIAVENCSFLVFKTI